MNTQMAEVAKMTAGLTGADIKNIVNQSVYNFLCEQTDKLNLTSGSGVTIKNLLKSIDEVSIGMEKPERKMTPEEIKRTAYHEAGHTLISYLLNTTQPPIKISIIPRGVGALGFTQQEPIDKKIYTYPEIIGSICVLFGGRAAEEIIFGSVGTGASDDFRQIDNLVDHLIHSCRFEELGFIGYFENNKDGKVLSNEASKIIQKVLTTAYSATQKMIYRHQPLIHQLAEYLQEHEEMTASDINKILAPELRKSVNTDSIIICK
jgi:ATP-dependent Zn protease